MTLQLNLLFLRAVRATWSRVHLTSGARSLPRTPPTTTTTRVQAQKKGGVDPVALSRIGGVSQYRGIR